MRPINKTDEIDGVVVEEDVDVILCGGNDFSDYYPIRPVYSATTKVMAAKPDIQEENTLLGGL